MKKKIALLVIVIIVIIILSIVLIDEKTKQYADWNSQKSVNMPILSECMTPVIYNEGKEKVIEADELEIKNCSWYDYIAQEGNTENGGTSKWANAKTKDGSIWVWVPRYAYKITYNNEEDKSAGGKIDVIFLKGTSNKDKNGEDVTKKGYTVHPAFKNGARNNYSNGEWNKELPGIWVSKFEAGYAGLKNTAGENVQAVDTSMIYKTVGNNVYGEVIENETKIKYPIYIGRTYSYNNLDVGEMFKLSKELTKEGNPYGFDSKNIDSHMMKNSEWGAVAYLAHSQYGRNGTKITINNVCNEKIVGASAITGYAADEINQAENIINEEIIGDELNNSYAWYTKKGTLASTTGNMYGIYDMVGGTIEYVAGYLENISENFMIYTENFGNIKTGNKYCTIYKNNTTEEKEDNYVANSKVYGDATIEISKQGENYTSWNGEPSFYITSNSAFFLRGGCYGEGEFAGIFCYEIHSGHLSLDHGFRTVLINI